LSMVTIFNIVVYFPRHDTSFYEFTIVPLNIPESAPEGPGEGSSEIERDGLGGEKLALRGGTGAALPVIQLPTLEFAELERLRVRQEGLQSLSRYDDLFQAPVDDSWSRFSRGLSGMSRSLSRLRLSGGSDGTLESGLILPTSQERIVHRPAEGFEAGLIWSTEPRDRKLLFAPPIEALWNVDGTSLQRPIEIVLQVNALGRVVNVFSPNVDERELVDAIQMTALQYRFEPLSLDEAGNQTATVRIVREGNGVAP